MVCFACGIALESFGPAFEVVEGASELGMVENLMESLRNRESLRVEAQESRNVETRKERSQQGRIDLGEQREVKQRMSIKNQFAESFEAHKEYRFGSGSSTPPFHRHRHVRQQSSIDESQYIRSSFSSSGISTPHIISPLSLRHSSSNSTGKVTSSKNSCGLISGFSSTTRDEYELSPYRKLDWSTDSRPSPVNTSTKDSIASS